MNAEGGQTTWRLLAAALAATSLLHLSAAYDPYGDRARFSNENGHLYIKAAKNRNITLVTSGRGYINIDDQDIVYISKMAKKSSDFVDRFITTILPNLEETPGFRAAQLVGRLRRLEVSLTEVNATSSDLYKSIQRRLRVLTNRVNNLTRNLRGLRVLLTADECWSSPCQNGGTCTDMFNGFHCRCTPGWQGSLCEKDVNECDDFAGTDLGCKNGATCRNFKGSYACTCAQGWYGLHCTERTYDCSVQSSAELCGNGVCLNQGGTGRGFICLCNEGWTTDKLGSCTVDKDECAGPRAPCSHDPSVECRNTPGSFSCGHCPQGYTGNGFHCTDLDECEVNNGGCSVSPSVDCINTRGSRKCGPCPPGFIGDGMTCTRSSKCQLFNGGCHPLATCRENPALQYTECICPSGYMGSGVGPSGCLPSTQNDLCNSSPCQNGATCIPIDANLYKCKCLPSYAGPNCTELVDSCASSPCKNGGTCERLIFNLKIDYYQCKCPDGFMGRNCEISQPGCVSRYFSRNGSVTWLPSNQTGVSHYYTCAWTIITNMHKVINLTFTDVRLRSIKTGSRCLLNYIEVYDGPQTSSPQILHYCDSGLPPPIISTFPTLLVTARLSSGNSFLGVKFNWTSIDPRCGGDINATVHGTLSSPGSPGRYPRNAHCVWKLLALPGQRIQLNFFSMDIENHSNCNFDYLEIRAGDSETGPLLRKLCNSTLPTPLTTSSSEAVIIFHSDDSRDGKGFQIAYSPLGSLPGCGGVFTKPHGQITPPSVAGGNEYLEALNCEWLIELPHSERIKISFDSFSLEQSDGCIYDSLEVFDGPNRRAGLIGRWCGQETISPQTSTSNVVLVVFTSDYTYNEGGFVLNYIAVCGGIYTGARGTLSSPYYPNHYPEDRTCTYTIEIPIGHAIKLSFQDFDMEHSEDCTYDKLQIYDGNNEHSPLIGEYCGSKKPGQIISTHNFLFLTFITDSTEHSRGFLANYTSVNISCGGILTGTSGTLNSPGYPEHYPSNQECTWVISTNPGTVIRLTWLSFHVDQTYRCIRDWVKIFDNNTVDSLAGQMGDKYCGNTLPPVMTSSSNRISIVFHTDETNAEPGFSASFTAINSKDVCGGNYFSIVGELSSPNFPQGYPNNLDCRWVITVPNGQQIELKPASFSIEKSSKCSNDFLEIRNGGTETSPLVGKYCGLNFKQSIISFTNQLYLRFVTDVDDSKPGFMLLWNGAQTGCGGAMTSSSGAIISPNYPQPYGRNGECIWKISVSQGSAIMLTIIDLDLEDHSTCSLDYVEIFDGGNRQSKRLARLCSQGNHPGFLNSSSNKMLIRFRSDISKQGRGFHLKYETICNITWTGFRGAIESPGFPDTENIDRQCSWTIQATQGNKVNLTFTQFELSDVTVNLSVNSCLKHYVNVYDGPPSDSSIIANYCSDVVPRRLISSSTDSITINYSAHQQDGYILSKSVFRMEWVISGCGGLFKGQKHGEITSPNYPNAYPHSTTCEWYISVLPGNSVVLTVDDLRVEDSRDCEYDALEVYGGPDNTSPLLGKLCKRLNNDSPSVLTSSGNALFIRFRTDSSSTGNGFHASYNTVPSHCGGTFTSTSGSFHSHNYPQNYDSHDDCNFIIQVDETHTVNLTFTDFDVDAIDKNCTNGYVKIYDGDSEKAPLLQTLCGNKIPQPIISTQNKLFVRHKTDGFSVAKGFYATYKTACGAIINTDTSGTINFSESNSSVAWESTSCTWIIKSKIPDAKVRIHFTFLDVESFAEARNTTGLMPGVLNILSGEGADAPVFRYYSQIELPPPIVVPSSVVTIFLDMTNSLNGRFILHYSVLDAACGGSALVAELGTIVSPNYPDPYPKNVECTWELLVAPGNTMKLHFKKFDLQPSESCNEEYLELRSKSASGSQIGVYCGSTFPERITLNATLWMKFRSGLDGSATGFEIEFALETDNDLTGYAGSIASPLYPIPYILESSYSWRISVKARHVIHFAFTDFYIESSSTDDSDEDGCYNTLVIYDGYDNTASELKVFCGIVTPKPFKSESNVVFIRMKHIYRGMQTHFILNWMQMEKKPPTSTTGVQVSDENCTTLVELKRGANSSYSFTSPGFPKTYPNSLNCSWIFQAPVGDHIYLKFQTINFEVTGDCVADSLTIYNGDNKGSSEEWVQIAKLCHESESLATYNGNQLVKVVFKSDVSVGRTGFSGKAIARCGGEIYQSMGVISEGPHVSCQWNITVKQGRTIKLTLEKFSVRGESPCSTNRLIIRDGGSEDSPLLSNKMCGDTVFDIPESKSNRLYIEYYASSTEGFTLRYEEKSLSCGQTIILDDTYKTETYEISSPNYPNIPPSHIECVWQVLAPSGESIHFEVTKRFDMTFSQGCVKEYLELREGSSEFGHLIGRYCVETPNYLVTDGNALFIKYFTDTDIPKDGFSAKVSLSKCGGTIYTLGENGSILSPGYPNAYEGNLNCTWKVVTRPSRIVAFDISLALGGSRSNCNKTSQDTLTLRDNIPEGIILEGPENIVMCGLITKTHLDSESNEVYINFISLSQPMYRSKRYFKLDYYDKHKECGGRLNSPSGIINSPHYPSSFEGMVYCTWRITVPLGNRITFRLIDLDLMSGNNRTRPQWISFYNGFHYVFIRSLSGNINNKTVIESSGNEMFITYRSLYKTTHRGFIGNYSSDQPALCGGTIQTSTKNGTIEIDKSLLAADKSFSCRYEVLKPLAPETESATITFSFEGDFLPTATSRLECLYSTSRLLITDVNSGIVGDFCSNTKPRNPYVVSKPHDRTVIRISKAIWKNSQKLAPFSLKWKLNNCGSTINEVSSTVFISSPGESGSYPPDTDCVWIVSATGGSTLKVRFKQFDLGTDCQDDYLKIHNGNSPLSPVMSNRCGSILPADLISQSSTIWIHFHSGVKKTKSGFSLEVSLADRSCGGILHSRSGEILSPGNPSNYPNDIECEWEIQAPFGFHIDLSFTGRFFIEESSGCTKDYIQIFDTNGTSLIKTCGRDLPSKPFNSTANGMRIVFKSNHNITGDGFKILFQWNCGGIIEVSKPGNLYSPGWPNAYSPGMNCSYTLKAPRNNMNILLRPETFELESASSNGCIFDKVQFFTLEARYSDLKSNGVYCGTTVPPLQISYGKLVIQFISDEYINTKGFHFVYSIDSCGGEIKEETVITNELIDSHNNWIRCTWNITAPEDRIVIVKISELNFHLTVNCWVDYISIYDTSNATTNGTSLGRVCGVIDNAPSFFKSSGNKLRIKLSRLHSHLSKSLRIIVSFGYGKKAGCGGEISVSQGENSITNPNINKNELYKDSIDCSWTVSTTAGNTVFLSFEKLDIKTCNITNSTDGCCDSVEIYDGASINTHLIGRYCGQTLPRGISSSRNFMTVRFIADLVGSASSFEVKVKSHQSPCGIPVLNATTTPQFLMSPNYPGNYSINVHCEWFILANRQAHVNIHLENIDIENSTDCMNDRLEIIDGAMSWRYGSMMIKSLRQIPSFIGKSVQKFCGEGKQLDLYSNTNNLFVKFISDSQGIGKGFKLSYSIAGCSRNYTEPQGRIVISRSNVSCVITISSPQNTTIALYFSKIQIFKSQSTCEENKLEVFDGSIKKTEVCGYAPPPPIYSNGTSMLLKLTSKRGLFLSVDITYTSTDQGQGCGGKFYNSRGVFTSPFYPGEYREYSYCCWDITVPMPNFAKVVFEEFDIGIKSTCGTDYVELFDISPETGARMSRSTYCSGDKPADFIGAGQSVSVCYRTSVHNSGIGWKASFSSYSNSYNSVDSD